MNFQYYSISSNYRSFGCYNSASTFLTMSFWRTFWFSVRTKFNNCFLRSYGNCLFWLLITAHVMSSFKRCQPSALYVYDYVCALPSCRQLPYAIYKPYASNKLVAASRELYISMNVQVDAVKFYITASLYKMLKFMNLMLAVVSRCLHEAARSGSTANS